MLVSTHMQHPCYSDPRSSLSLGRCVPTLDLGLLLIRIGTSLFCMSLPFPMVVPTAIIIILLPLSPTTTWSRAPVVIIRIAIVAATGALIRRLVYAARGVVYAADFRECSVFFPWVTEGGNKTNLCSSSVPGPHCQPHRPPTESSSSIRAPCCRPSAPR